MPRPVSVDILAGTLPDPLDRLDVSIEVQPISGVDTAQATVPGEACGQVTQRLAFVSLRLVNLGEQSKLASRKLRPLQIAYESKKFMLPIRLGMANAPGPPRAATP